MLLHTVTLYLRLLADAAVTFFLCHWNEIGLKFRWTYSFVLKFIIVTCIMCLWVWLQTQLLSIRNNRRHYKRFMWPHLYYLFKKSTQRRTILAQEAYRQKHSNTPTNQSSQPEKTMPIFVSVAQRSEFPLHTVNQFPVLLTDMIMFHVLISIFLNCSVGSAASLFMLHYQR